MPTHAPSSLSSDHRRQRVGVMATLAGLVAVSAYGGALGLMAGFVDLGPTATARLPWHSPVLGGLALAVIVATPAAVLTWLAAQADPRRDTAAVAVGLILIVWIGVEVAVIRELSFLQPLFMLIGGMFVWLGSGTPLNRLTR